MKNRTNGVRLFAALLLIVTLMRALSSVSAQEVTGEFNADGLSTAYVSVDCVFDDLSGTTNCTFTPSGGSSAVTSVLVPASVMCSAIVSSSASIIDGGLVQDASGESISAVFSGLVTVSGGATYTLGLDGLASDVAGDGLSCATVVEDETGEEPPVEESPTAESTEEITPEATPESTPEIDVTVEPTTEPTPDQDDNGEVPPVEDQSEPVANVDVVVSIYNCTTDPGGADPSTVGGCSAAGGIGVSVTADGSEAGSGSTDGNGQITFSVPEGSQLVVTEAIADVPDGLQPLYGADAYLVAEDGAAVVFVNLTETVAGRLQIVNGSCPTSGDTRTEFRVIEPRSVVAASTPACTATGGTVFQIFGGSLGPDGVTVVTGGDGAWRGYLPAGVYSVVDDSGESADVTVVTDDISLVIVVDYVAAPLGVLNVSRFECTSEVSSGVNITFSNHASNLANDADCEASDGDIIIEVQTEVTSSSFTSFSLGPDGVAEIELPSGSYLLIDDYTGEEAAFTVDGGSRIYAAIQDIVLTDDGVGPGGGGDGGTGGGDGGGDGTGGGPDDGGGNSGGGDGSGNPDDGGNGNGGGGSNGGEVDGPTSGGVDAGTTDNLTDDEEIAAVNSLPKTGAYQPIGQDGNPFALLTAVLGMIALVGTCVALRRRGQGSL